jgi:hypothetical protein
MKINNNNNKYNTIFGSNMRLPFERDKKWDRYLRKIQITLERNDTDSRRIY